MVMSTDKDEDNFVTLHINVPLLALPELWTVKRMRKNHLHCLWPILCWMFVMNEMDDMHSIVVWSLK
jgi:hypothetical protein